MCAFRYVCVCVYISLEHILEDRRGSRNTRRRRPENASWCAIFTNFRLKYFGQVALAAAQACVRTHSHKRTNQASAYEQTLVQIWTYTYTYIYIYSFKDERGAASARRCSVTNLKRLPLLLDAKNKARNENVAKVKELLVHTLGNLFKTSIFLVSQL